MKNFKRFQNGTVNINQSNTTTMSDLLVPRYKVIADYPCRPHPIGSVISFTNDPWDTRVLFTLPGAEHRYPESKFKEYPNLFKPLQWWEEREIEDLPEYLKNTLNGQIVKAVSYSIINETVSVRALGVALSLYVPNFVPATEADFLSYTASTREHKEGGGDDN